MLQGLGLGGAPVRSANHVNDVCNQKPNTCSQYAGLRLVQVQLDPMQYYAFHVEVLTQEGNPCRLSVSNVYDASTTQASQAPGKALAAVSGLNWDISTGMSQLEHLSGSWTCLCSQAVHFC